MFLAPLVVLGLAAACGGDGHQARSGTVDTSPTSAPPAAAPAAAPALSPADDWLTYHHDAGRSGVAGDQAPLGSVKKAWSPATPLRPASWW